MGVQSINACELANLEAASRVTVLYEGQRARLPARGLTRELASLRELPKPQDGDVGRLLRHWLPNVVLRDLAFHESLLTLPGREPIAAAASSGRDAWQGCCFTGLRAAGSACSARPLLLYEPVGVWQALQSSLQMAQAALGLGPAHQVALCTTNGSTGSNTS